MQNTTANPGFFLQLAASGRIVFLSVAVCCLLYSLLILGIGQTLAPYTADGALIRNERGVTVGSEFIAQRFSRPEYFWPRPSAVDYDAAASGGSNLSPKNPQLRIRAQAIIAAMGAAGGKKIPADLVTASGSGLDPQITLNGAKYQADRVAAARGLSLAVVTALLQKHAKRSGGTLTPEPLVNVLLVNMALDRLRRGYEQQPRR